MQKLLFSYMKDQALQQAATKVCPLEHVQGYGRMLTTHSPSLSRSQHRCILKELQYIVNERRMLDDDGSPLLEQSLLDLDQSAATKVLLRTLVSFHSLTHARSCQDASQFLK